jgi:hypothetical protein
LVLNHRGVRLHLQASPVSATHKACTQQSPLVGDADEYVSVSEPDPSHPAYDRYGRGAGFARGHAVARRTESQDRQLASVGIAGREMAKGDAWCAF